MTAVKEENFKQKCETEQRNETNPFKAQPTEKPSDVYSERGLD